MIKVLDSFVADKIAAGEVIERPVSAVKELVENSIDAGSHTVIVEIRKGGKSYIRVTDDGCGISYDEAETAFLRHATSKINSVTDLDNIVSLGFRGEALASISAVSMLTMVTRTAGDPTGVKLVLHGGRVVSKERVGANTGTTIIAENLFYNTPARRKFMKSDAREASAVIELIQQYAVCYADLRFMMINNGQTLFTTSGDGDRLSVIKLLYPGIAKNGLIPVLHDRVTGFVSDPGSALSTRKGQLFFVNGRLVSSPVIEKGLEEGYNGRIFSGFPVGVLFIEAEPSQIDINIHPGKQEIRFLDQDDVKKDIAEAVGMAVMTEAGVPKAFVKNIEIAEEKHFNHSADNDTSAEQTSIKEYLLNLERPNDKKADDEAVSVSETSVISSYEAFSSDSGSFIKNTASEQAAVNTRNEIMARSAAAPFDFADLTYKGYVFDTYIIMQGKGEIYIFDQHAAHERVFYEKFMRGYKNSAHSPQPVLTTFTINVSHDVYSNDREWIDDLRYMGYDIEDFGECTFIVRGIPPYMTLDEAEGFARGFAEAAGENSGSNQIVIDKLIMKSCKSAVKANDVLSEMEIHDLMSQLAECSNPYSCPHGRPTFIKFTSYDIERSFRRK